MKPVRIPIEDVLDLHTFQPRDIPDLLDNYFSECIKAGIQSVRVIHGKGKGIQKKFQRGAPRGRRLGCHPGGVKIAVASTLTGLRKGFTATVWH
jgi:hypothetical protein